MRKKRIYVSKKICKINREEENYVKTCFFFVCMRLHFYILISFLPVELFQISFIIFLSFEIRLKFIIYKNIDRSIDQRINISVTFSVALFDLVMVFYFHIQYIHTLTYSYIYICTIVDC